MGNEAFDLIIIGAGPGGYTAAIRAAQLGLKVACIEKEPALGGTCLRIGCIPSKCLLESSHHFAAAKSQFGSHGIKIGSVDLDLSTMLKRKDSVVSTLTKGIEALFKKNKITRYGGTARIETTGKVLIMSSDGNTELPGKNIIVATGSRPALLPGVELSERIGTSTEALAYAEVPKRLIVIGAGYIGVELGSVWQRLGSQVTVVEYLDRILFGMDAEIAAEAKKLFEKQGLRFQLQARVTRAIARDQECVVDCEGMEPLMADRVLVAVGRAPNTDKLGLEALGIELHKKGFIPVDEHFRTNVEGVYAIGDAIAGPMLAHKAEEEGVACVEHIATGHGHVNYNAIPAVVYTDPEIASVGQTEEQLKEAGIEYRKGVFPFRANARARTLASLEGTVKCLADATTDRLLGVHIIGPHAGDLINEVAAAMTFGATSEDLTRVCHAHPTLGETLREAALGVAKRSLNI